MQVDKAASAYVCELFAITAEVAVDGILVVVRIERPNKSPMYVNGFNTGVDVGTAEFAEVLVKWAISPPRE